MGQRRKVWSALQRTARKAAGREKQRLGERGASGVKGSGMPWGSRPGGRCWGWQPREGAATGPGGERTEQEA